jgi:hypothetical protein
MNHATNTEAERAAFEAWARDACNMPERTTLNWNAVWTKAAWEGWQARATQASAEPVKVAARCADELEHVLWSSTISGCAVTLNHIEAGQFLAALKPATTPATPSAKPEQTVAREIGIAAPDRPPRSVQAKRAVQSAHDPVPNLWQQAMPPRYRPPQRLHEQ